MPSDRVKGGEDGYLSERDNDVFGLKSFDSNPKFSRRGEAPIDEVMGIGEKAPVRRQCYGGHAYLLGGAHIHVELYGS